MKETYVTLAGVYGSNDIRVLYAGDDLSIAKSVVKPDDEVYAWVETWVEGTRINKEDI